MSNTDSLEAIRLREEGNKCFERKEFSSAYDKYTAAIEKCGPTAVLLANRAGCHLCQQKFLDASNDALEATKLDPEYHKAWGRLAAAYMALLRAKSAATAFQNALDNLPKSNLTPAQQNQKRQYEKGLRECESKAASHPTMPKVIQVQQDGFTDSPWQRSLKILKDTKYTPAPTSAWVIGQAYEEWRIGLNHLQALKEVPYPDGRKLWLGYPAVFQFLSNGVLRDRRVFHTEGSFFDKIEFQATYERGLCNGWKDEGPKLILKEAQERVRRSGWNGTPTAMGMRGGTRKAISSQVCLWIIRAFILSGLQEDCRASESIYRDTIDFLEDGRKIWANINKDDRGFVFEDTFVRGVRVLHLEVFAKATSDTASGKYTVMNLFKLAKELYEESLLANNERKGILDDTGFTASFCTYPIGEALSTMAFCYWKRSEMEIDEEKQRTHMRSSGELYQQSTNYYFEDDERYCFFLALALDAFWHARVGLDVTLSLMKALKASESSMKKIWIRASSSAPLRDSRIAYCLSAYEEILRKISEGELKEDSPFAPDPFRP